MLASAVIGYGRRAYAACVPAGGSNFICSGASTGQSISAANANVSTQPGFSVTTASSNALAITGSGDIFYTDTNFSPLTATSGNGLNVSNAAGQGSITINTNGAITARNYGIRGRNFGSGALTITANGDVISTGTGVTSLSRGIIAVNSGTDLSVTTGVGASVSGLRYGILSRNYGTGSTTVTVNGDVTAGGTTGTDVGILARGNVDVTVTTAAGTTVSGQETGIFARSDGNGSVNITVNGDVTGTNDDGIYARTGSSGSIAITVASTSQVTSNGTGADDFAIDTSSFVTSSTSLTVAGTLNGGAGGAVRFQNLDDRLELHPTAIINGTVFAGAGTDTFALGGTGAGSFDVSQIGPAAQFRDFEVFEKVGAGQWTLTGTNTSIASWTVNDGVLSVQGTMPNTAFTVNGGTLALVGTGNISSVDLTGATSVFDISGTTAGATIPSLSGVAGSMVVLGNQTLTLSNASATFGGVMSGTGGLTLNAGTETLTGTNTYTGATTINGGTLLVDGSIASSSSVTANSGGTVGGLGTLSSTTINGGILSPGPPIGTLNVQGTLGFSPTSTYRVDISPATSDRTNVTGTATLAGTVHVVAQPGTYPRNSTYTILTAAGGLSGTFSDLTFASDFLCACLSYDATNVYLRITSTGLTFAGVGQTPNQVATGAAVELLDTGNSIYDVIVLGNAEQARAAFDLLSGEIHASVIGIMLDDSRHVRDAVLGRLRQAYGSGAGSPPTALTGNAALAYVSGDKRASSSFAAMESGPWRGPVVATWAQAIGTWGHAAGDGNAATLRRSVGGVVSGFDVTFDERWRLGFSGGYTRSSLRVDDRSSSGNLDNYHLALYGGGQFGMIGLRAGIAQTWHDVTTNRNIAFTSGESCCASNFSDSVKADYRARTVQAFGEIGVGFSGSRAVFEPFVNVAYVNVHTDGFTETGGPAALTGSTGDTEATYSTVGARAATSLRAHDVVVMPHASAAWQRAFGDLQPGRTLSFASAGNAFGVAGLPVAKDSLLLEAGLDIKLFSAATLDIVYSARLSSGVSDNGIGGRFRWRF